MAREVRTFAEGSLRWVQASGTGGWATAAAPISALVGFVQAGQNFQSAQSIATVMERGIPHHHKFVSKEPPQIQFTYLQAVTANLAQPATASGASTPQVHIELRSTDTELPSVTAQYWQFHNGVMLNRTFNEGENGNQIQETWKFLSMIGPTASGWLG
jgi:hypothetical protein